MGLKVSIVEVDSVPDTFQVFIGDFAMPPDPDQYLLWHTNQPDNITKLDNKRIDKLLEDGRKAFDRSARKATYIDLQKYLLAETPAVFLFFPYEYTVTRI